MTDTLIENSKIEDILGMMKYQFPSKPETDGSFSTLMTNASNKVEQTQTNFVDTAVKSNTSSINKYALADNKTTQKASVKKDNKNEIQVKTTTINTKQDNKSIKNPQSSKTTNEQNALKSTKTETVSQDEKVNTNKKTDSFSPSPVSNNQTSISDDSSDISPQNINNNSLESSPVSLQTTETTEQTDTEIVNIDTDNLINQTQNEVKTLVENILITFDIPVNNNNDAINTEEIFNSSDDSANNFDFVINAIDEISAEISERDLSQDTKDKILSALEKIKEAVSEIKYDTELDETIKEAKNILDNLILKVNSSSEDKNIVSDIDNKKVPVQKEDNSENIKALIEKLTDTLDKKDIKKDETVKEIKNTVVELKNEIENKKDISTDDKKLIKELDKLSEKIENNKLEIKDTKEALKLFAQIKDTKEDLKPSIQIKDTKELDLKTEIVSEVKENKFENLKINDDDKISEIVDKLKEFEKTEEYQKLDENDKIDLQKITQKLSEIKEDVKEPEKIIVDVKKEVSEIINKETDKSNNNQKIAENDKTISLKSDIVKENHNSQRQETDKNYDEKNENVKISEVKKSDDSEKVEFEDIDIDIQNNDKEVESDNSIKSNEFIDKLKSNFLESIEYSESSPVVISVADEVVKFTLSENNSLSPTIPVGNVTYDPTQSAVTIKNIQNISQYQPVQEPSESNILNQIGDKLTQLKDSQKMTIILRPDDLGRLAIELTNDKNGLTTSIVAQNETVRNYIERNINNLRTQLSEAGINVNSIQIKTSGQEGATTYEGNQNKELAQENNAKQNQNPEQKQNQKEKENLAHLRNYDMHFVKDFSNVMEKTLSYMN